MTEFPAGPADEQTPGTEPAEAPEFTGFDAELAAAMKDLGARVGPDEFDSRAIRRRTARRRSYQVLASSAAALAVVAGATAFAAQRGPTADSTAQRGPTAGSTVQTTPTPTPSSSPSVQDTDPLTVPGYFSAAPGGGSPIGYSVYGASASLTLTQGGDDGDPALQTQDVQAAYSLQGVQYVADVQWTGNYSANIADVSNNGPNTEVGTVDGRAAYYSENQHSLAFWSGSQGYALLYGFIGLDSNTAVTDPTVLLQAAEAFDAKPTDVPLPLRITGLDSAEVAYAELSQDTPGSSWWLELKLLIDGRTYEIDANPGAAVTPTPTGGQDTPAQVSATKSVDGLGITVSTDAGKSGSASAPTVAQVLADVTSLGTDPSGWTTNVMVK